jgi:excisionase family DNA binding protein
LEAKRRAKGYRDHVAVCAVFAVGFGKGEDDREKTVPCCSHRDLRRTLKNMADESDVPEVMDIHRASQYLGISRETLYKYLNEERIPAFKLGNRWRLKKTVLDRWMESESTRREGPQRG